MRVTRWPALAVLAFLVSCAKPTADVGPGVSLLLARERAENISDLRYRLKFVIPEAIDESIGGEADIRFKLADTSEPVVLDFRESANKVGYVTVNGDLVSHEFQNEHIILSPDYFDTGENTVGIEFIAGDTSLNRNPGYLYTLFVPDRARTAFPLFDQPDLKATYELTLDLPAEWTAMSNAPVARTHHEGGRAEFRFRESDLIPSYLFSFVAGRFQTISRDVDGRRMTMLHRETDAEKVERNVDDIFNLHAASLDWLEEYTGIEYPYQKFGFALIPAFQYGGMEHVGAIQYRASSLFLDDAPSQSRLLGRAGLIAHETAHMWFGNLVTMEWFNDVWTKEVFAGFMAAKIVNPSFPDVNHDLNFLTRMYPRAYSVDRTDGANPIRQPLPNLNEAGQMYGAIIYNKAPIMMRHLEEMIGEEVFREGMQEYLSTYAFGNATWPLLIDILDRKSDEDVRSWSQVWVETPGREAIQAQWEAAGSDSGHFRYGLVPVNATDLKNLDPGDDVGKAAAMINLYEQMLAGNEPAPTAYFEFLLNVVEDETNELLLDLGLSQMESVYWRLLSDEQRAARSPLAERVLRDAMLAQDEPSRRKVYFRSFANIATTPEGVEWVRGAWTGEEPIEDLPLAENELIDLAQDLAIKLPDRADELIAFQLGRTANADNARKLEFIAPSVSASRSTRDGFFESLADEKNRQTESWVLDALANLHHPLRRVSSETYLYASLDLLEEIQVTGDIFFPKRWLDETLQNQRSDAAVETVRQFLLERPDYNQQLRMKILQSADLMIRANALVGGTDAE